MKAGKKPSRPKTAKVVQEMKRDTIETLGKSPIHQQSMHDQSNTVLGDQNRSRAELDDKDGFVLAQPNRVQILQNGSQDLSPWHEALFAGILRGKHAKKYLEVNRSHNASHAKTSFLQSSQMGNHRGLAKVSSGLNYASNNSTQTSMMGGRHRASHQRDAAVFCSDALNLDYESNVPQTGHHLSLSQFLNRQRNFVYQKTGVNNAYQPRVSFQIGGNSITSSQRSSKLGLANRLRSENGHSHGYPQSPVCLLSGPQLLQSAASIHENKSFSVAGKRLNIQKAEAARGTLTSLLMRRTAPLADQSKSTAGFEKSEEHTA